MSHPPEFSQQILVRVAEGQTPENVAKQMGRTPATIRRCLAMIDKTAMRPLPRLPLLQRASVLYDELVALLVSPRESLHAARISRQLLQLYWIVASVHPGVARRELYRKVVMARKGGDEAEAEAVLKRAEQSFAHWPKLRELTFADVVHYLAVSEYLTHGERIATRIHMGRLVAGRIPDGL